MSSIIINLLMATRMDIKILLAKKSYFGREELPSLSCILEEESFFSKEVRKEENIIVKMKNVRKERSKDKEK